MGLGRFGPGGEPDKVNLSPRGEVEEEIDTRVADVLIAEEEDQRERVAYSMNRKA